jgi:hypothetical protein
MATLASLKLTATQKPTQVSEVQLRRSKLLKRLNEQVQLARAQQAGTQFHATKLRSVTDKETGVRTKVETHKSVKQWWFTADNGKLALCIRFGPKVLELTRGKYAIEIGNEKDLVPTLETVVEAVKAGELDTAIEAAATKVRAGFKK